MANTDEIIGIIDEVFKQDEDIINDLPETNDIEQPEDDKTIPDADEDSGESSDPTPETIEAGDKVDPDPEDIIDENETQDITESPIAVEESEVTPIIDNKSELPTIGNIQQGDRVMIALINGQPTVLGTVGSGDRQQEEINVISADVAVLGTVVAGKANITDLDATNAKVQNLETTKANVTELNAATGRITNLEANKANVSDLDAANAKITDLQANKASVQALAATNANVEALQTDKADVTDLNVTNANVTALQTSKANVTDLNAAKGRITTLEGDYADLNTVVAGKVDTSTLTANYITANQIATDYAKVNAANINTATLRNAWVDNVMVQTGLLAHEGTIYTLDAIQLNADRITAGTIDVQRLIVTVDGHKYMVQFDAQGTPSYQKLDGDVIEDLTITADKIVAGAVTAQKITTENIVGTGGWINLRSGTFNYNNATSGEGISWDGTNLSINASTINIGSTNVMTTINDVKDSIDEANTKANQAKTAVQNVQTLIRQYSDGVLVCKTNNSVGALVNADGSFDVSNVTWSGGTPTAGSSLASFGSTARIGSATGNNLFIDSDSIDIRNGTLTLASFTGDNTKFYDPVYKKELATFGTSGAIIGAINEQRFIIEKDGIKSTNDKGATVFSVNSTDGTVVTEAQVASGGESSYYPSSKTVVFDTVGTGFTTNTTFYTKKLTAIIEIWNSAKPLTNVKVNSVTATSTLVNSYSGYWYSSTHSIDLSPFTFTYGTSRSATYQITASFVNDYGDSYNLTANVSINYDGNVTLTVQPLTGECVRTSGDNENIARMDLLGSKIIYDVIYQSSAYTKAPSMTFGTRGKNAIMAPFSVTIGEDLYANNDNQLSIGRYNINNDEFFPLAFVIGNGSSDMDRSNAFSVDWDGNTIVEGNLEINGELLSNINATKLNDCNGGIDPRKYYYLDGSGTNKPTTAWVFLKCFEISGGNVVQIASVMNTTDPYMYLRSRNSSGTWSSWKTFSMAGHKHAASDITSGTLSIARGGTGSTGTTYTETIANIITKGTNVTISNARYAQWGKIAQISLVLKTTAALSGNTMVATLVDGKHPKTFTGATVNYDGTGIIYTNGAIHVNKSYASGTTLNIEATYILP